MELNVIQNNNNIKKERYVIYVYNYDKFGNKTLDESSIVTQEINLAYDQYIQVLTEDYDSDSKTLSSSSIFGLSEKDGCFKTIKIDKSSENYKDVLNTSLINSLNTTATSIIFNIITSYDDIDLNIDFLNKLLSNYKNINIDLNYNQSIISFPNINISVDTISIKNSNISIDNLQLHATENLYLFNCNFFTNNDYGEKSISLCSNKKIEVVNTFIRSKMRILMSSIIEDNLLEWINTDITLSNIVIDYEDIEYNKNDPVFIFSKANKLNISSFISYKDIPYTPLIKISNIKDVTISDIERRTVNSSVQTSSVIFSNVSTVNVSDVKYFSDNEPSENISFFDFLNSKNTSTYSFSNLNIYKIHVANIKGLVCDKITIMDSIFNNFDKFVVDGMCTINEINIINCKLRGRYLNICDNINTIYLSDCDVDCEDGFKFFSFLKINIKNSIFKSKNGDCIISFGEKTSVSLSKSTFDIYKNIECTYQNSKKDSISNILSVTDVSIISKKIIIQNLLSCRIDECKMDSVESFNCSNISSLHLFNRIDCKKPNNFNLSNIKDLTGLIYLFNINKTKPSITLHNCFGEMDITNKGNDINADEFINLVINGSKIISEIENENKNKLNFSIWSNNSLGSFIRSSNRDSVKLSLDMRSRDLSKVKISTDKNEKPLNEYLLYGIVD